MPMPAKTSKPADEPAETPHYHGHRERLRERFHTAGPDALSDYELLELALFPALPRRDTKPLAKSLLKTFGSFAEVIHAPVARLREIDGIGDASINQLKLIAAAVSRVAKGEVKQRTALSSWNDVIDYCRTSMVSNDNIVFTFSTENQTLLQALSIRFNLNFLRAAVSCRARAALLDQILFAACAYAPSWCLRKPWPGLRNT